MSFSVVSKRRVLMALVLFLLLGSLGVRLAQSAVKGITKTSQPQFVRDESKSFYEQFPRDFLYAKMIAWGTATTKAHSTEKGQPFTWVVFSDANGFLQLKIDRLLKPDTMKEIKSVVIAEKREGKTVGEAHLKAEYKGLFTWIGGTSNWVPYYCKDGGPESCEHNQLIEVFLFQVLRNLEFLDNLVVEEYFE